MLHLIKLGYEMLRYYTQLALLTGAGIHVSFQRLCSSQHKIWSGCRLGTRRVTSPLMQRLGICSCLFFISALAGLLEAFLKPNYP